MGWFLVIDPIYGEGNDSFGGRQTELDRLLTKIKGYIDRDYPPTDNVFARVEQNTKTKILDYNEAGDYYNQRYKAFNSFFDGRTRVPVAGQFTADYNSNLEKLVGDYRERFDIQAAEDETGLRPDYRGVSNVNTREDVIRAMKQYWIAKAVIDTLTELNVGGLREIDYDQRTSEDENAAYSYIEATIDVDMPFSKVEAFLTSLYRHPKALFRLDQFNASKEQQHVAPFLRGVREKEVDAAVEVPPEAGDIAEPSVRFRFTFSALDLVAPRPGKLPFERLIEEDLLDGDEEEDEDEEDEDDDE